MSKIKRLSWWKYFFMGYRKYFSTRSRSSKREYWYFFLFNYIAIIIVAWIFNEIVNLIWLSIENNDFIGIIYWLTLFWMITPLITAASRRINDTWKNKYLFLWFIPFIWWFIILFYVTSLPSEQKANKYGSIPMI